MPHALCHALSLGLGQVRPNLKQVLLLNKIKDLPKALPPVLEPCCLDVDFSLPWQLSGAQLRQVDDIVSKEVPHLRRMAAPAPI